MQYIYLFTRQQTERGRYFQIEQLSGQLPRQFFMVLHKSSSCLQLFPFPPYDSIESSTSLTLLPGPTNNITTVTRQHTQFPLAFVCSFAARLQTFNEIPTHKSILALKGISQTQIHPVVPGFNFSNNISISQVRVNIKKTECDTIFEISQLLKNLGEKTSIILSYDMVKGLIFK